MDAPLSCTCGTLKGVVRHPRRARRGVCYCKDCQAFARFLGRPAAILDSSGGTDLVATIGEHVTISQGSEMLACMSLSSRGPLRWYARCCNTPIGNTLRNYRTPYVALVHSCLEAPGLSLDRSFGPVRMRVNTASATGEPKPRATPIRTIAAGLHLVALISAARITGRYSRTSFFDPSSGAPVAEPNVLTREARAVLYG